MPSLQIPNILGSLGVKQFNNIFQPQPKLSLLWPNVTKLVLVPWKLNLNEAKFCTYLSFDFAEQSLLNVFINK